MTREPRFTDDQADDWQAEFDERAAIIEFEAGMPRYVAERDASKAVYAAYPEALRTRWAPKRLKP